MPIVLLLEAALGDPSGFENSPLLENSRRRWAFRYSHRTMYIVSRHVLAIVALELSHESTNTGTSLLVSEPPNCDIFISSYLRMAMFMRMVQYLINRTQLSDANKQEASDRRPLL